MDRSTHYLLLEDSCATQIGKFDQALLYVSAGSLWIVNDQQVEPQTKNHSSPTEFFLYLKSCELINVYLSCSHKAVVPIGEIEFELLLAVDSFAERKHITTETNLLQTGRDIYDRYLDQFVSGQMCEIFVTILNYPGLPDNTCGLIQYAGSLQSSPGIWFGVKLPFVYKGLGATDGSLEGKRFFECEENCGLFLSIDKITIYHPHKGFDPLDPPDDRSSTKSDVVSICEAPIGHSSGPALAKPPLELGERIVWISDDGPELGTVRWIGILPDARLKEYTIGVEFDKPIGTGTGKYNNERLFRTLQNHASLIPAIGLMKAEEFFGSKDNVPEASLPRCQMNVGSNTWMECLPEEKPFFNDAFHSSVDQSEVGSSSDSTSQHQSGEAENQTSTKASHRHVLGSSDDCPSGVAGAGIHKSSLDGSRQKCTRPVGTLEHCYENVEKDETGRILNRDSNAFQAVTENRGGCPEHRPHIVPSSFRRSFDDIYAENKKSKFGASTVIADYDRVRSLHRSELGRRNDRSEVGSDARSRTLETYSTARSYACKVFDENDVPLRLPYTTGRSTFYGRADDESLHAEAGGSSDLHPVRNSSSSGKSHRGIFKFISKRAPNLILQQLNKTFRNSFLPPSFHRRSSSDSAPTVPERSSAVRGSLIPFNSSGCSVACRRQEEEEEEEDKAFCPVLDVSSLPACEGQSACLKMRSDHRCAEASSPVPQTPESSGGVCTPVAAAASGSLSTKSSRSAVTFQPRPSSSMQMERHKFANSFPEYDVGSRVEVDVDGQTCHGVIRWMGCFKSRPDILVGIELEEEHVICTDGKIGGRRFFSCPPGRAYFTFVHYIRKDSRSFPLFNLPNTVPQEEMMYPPLCFDDLETLAAVLNGKALEQIPACDVADAVLFSMFAFCQAFDSMLLGGRGFNASPVDDLKRSLLEHVVCPLRCGLPVHTSRIDPLRRFVQENFLSRPGVSVKGPLQFYNHLVQSLNADPQLRFSSGSCVHAWSIRPEDEAHVSPSVQRLLEISLFQADLKFSRIPLCLVIHVQKRPRDLVVPSADLDITDMLQNSLRECNICGKLGTLECRECFEPARLLSATVFCEACSIQYHGHVKRSHHRPVGVEVDGSVSRGQVEGSAWADRFREKLELCAVVCSREFHCTSFVRTGLGRAAPWMFYGSCGEEAGRPRPRAGICSFLPDLISSETPVSQIVALSKTELPPLVDCFLFDADVYVYQFPALLPYK